MEAPKGNPWKIPALGLSAAGFAAILVIANLVQFDKAAEISARYLAAGIPGWICTAYFKSSLRAARARHASVDMVWFLKAITTLLEAASQFACMLGLYWMFRHISVQTGYVFLAATLGCYVLYGAIHWAQALVIFVRTLR